MPASNIVLDCRPFSLLFCSSPTQSHKRSNIFIQLDDWIRIPENVKATKMAFYQVSGVPNVVRAIDSAHVQVTGLRKDVEHGYVDRKR